MKTFNRYILPAILIFLGAVVGVLLTSYYSRKDWQEKINYDKKTKLFDEKLKLIERTTAVFAKIPAVDDEFETYLKIKTDTTEKKRSREMQIELAEKLGAVRSELWTVLLLDQMYFSDSTRSKISKVFGESKRNSWWKIPEKEYNAVTETMTLELNTAPTAHANENYLIQSSMSDVEKILWTSFATLIGGITIYVVGRTIEKFVLEPLQDYRKSISSIADTLIFYADIYSNATVAKHEDKIAASRAIRKLASELSAKTHQVTFYNFFSRCYVIPSYNNSMDAVAVLIGFSNSLWQSDFNEVDERRKKIEKLLKIRS